MDDADLSSFREQELIEQAVNRTKRSIHHTMTHDGPVDCDDCGKPIPEKRLEAAPWATRCVVCQSAAERR